MVHRLSDLRDFNQAGHGEVPAGLADLETACEALEVMPLCRPQRMRPEERNDELRELVPCTDDEPVQVLLMVVAAPIDRHRANAEEVPELVEAGGATRSLHNDEAVAHLVSGSVASPPSPMGLFGEADGETTLPIYEADYPAGPDQPFLLVFRTSRIVTAHTTRVGRVPDGYSGFPAYSRMLIATLL